VSVEIKALLMLPSRCRLAFFPGSHYNRAQDVQQGRRAIVNCVQFYEKKDWGPGKSAAAGAVVGAIIGAVAGRGAILVAAAGAVVGGLAAKLRDSGFKDERLEELGETLKPGTSALVAIVEHERLTAAEKQFAGAGGEVVSMEVANDLAERLAIGGEVTYTAVGTEESIVTDEAPSTEEGQKVV
jgi:outer membrane lipoprotein SlyB